MPCSLRGRLSRRPRARLVRHVRSRIRRNKNQRQQFIRLRQANAHALLPRPPRILRRNLRQIRLAQFQINKPLVRRPPHRNLNPIHKRPTLAKFLVRSKHHPLPCLESRHTKSPAPSRPSKLPIGIPMIKNQRINLPFRRRFFRRSSRHVRIKRRNRSANLHAQSPAIPRPPRTVRRQDRKRQRSQRANYRKSL